MVGTCKRRGLVNHGLRERVPSVSIFFLVLCLLNFFLSLTTCFVVLPLLLSGAVIAPFFLAFPNIALLRDAHLPVFLPVGQAGRSGMGGTVFPSAWGPATGLAGLSIVPWVFAVDSKPVVEASSFEREAYLLCRVLISLVLKGLHAAALWCVANIIHFGFGARRWKTLWEEQWSGGLSFVCQHSHEYHW